MQFIEFVFSMDIIYPFVVSGIFIVNTKNKTNEFMPVSVLYFRGKPKKTNGMVGKVESQLRDGD